MALTDVLLYWSEHHGATSRLVLCMLQSPDGEMTWGQEMQSALEDLVVLLKDEHTISSFELYNSGLVQTLLSILCNVSVGSLSWLCCLNATSSA